VQKIIAQVNKSIHYSANREREIIQNALIVPSGEQQAQRKADSGFEKSVERKTPLRLAKFFTHGRENIARFKSRWPVDNEKVPPEDRLESQRQHLSSHATHTAHRSPLFFSCCLLFFTRASLFFLQHRSFY